MNFKCAKCGCRIKPGQLYIRRAPAWYSAVRERPIHVACPNAREIAHAIRMGREP